jgi:hypothetical protein
LARWYPGKTVTLPSRTADAALEYCGRRFMCAGEHPNTGKGLRLHDGRDITGYRLSDPTFASWLDACLH